MKHSAGLAILQGQSSLCRMIEISKLSKVDDPFTKHPGMWWTVLAPTQRELSYETQHLTDAWKQKFADARGSSRCFCFESSLWQKKMKKEERRIPKKKKPCRIFLCIYWLSDSTADTLIPWSDLAIDNCHSSPPLMLSWQQPSESPKTPQISPASPNLATAPSKTTRPKNLPSQSQQNSWWNNSWWKTISCETQKSIPRISSKAYNIFYLSFWACPLANFRSSSTCANSFETIDNPWFGPQWWDLTDSSAMSLRQICMKNWRIFQFQKNHLLRFCTKDAWGGGIFTSKNHLPQILHFPKIMCFNLDLYRCIPSPSKPGSLFWQTDTSHVDILGWTIWTKKNHQRREAQRKTDGHTCIHVYIHTYIPLLHGIWAWTISLASLSLASSSAIWTSFKGLKKSLINTWFLQNLPTFHHPLYFHVFPKFLQTLDS
jgi:hypothetical protein